MSDTQEPTSQAVALRDNPARDLATNALAIVAKAAADPNVDPAKMHSLLDFQERIMKGQAEIDFNQAFTRLQMAIGKVRISKGGEIKIDGRQPRKYARYEDIDRAIRPLLQAEGFAIRFSSVPDSKGLTVKGTLSHTGGHSIETFTPMVTDVSTKVMNGQQAIGSASSYAQRYIVKMLLNLVFEGEDDDGQKSGHVEMDSEGVKAIEDALRAKGALGKDVKQFLQYMGVGSIPEISANDYNKAMIAISRMSTGGAN